MQLVEKAYGQFGPETTIHKDCHISTASSTMLVFVQFCISRHETALWHGKHYVSLYPLQVSS